MLNLSRESEDCLTFFFCQEHGYCQFQFKSHHMKGKIIWKTQFAKANTASIFASARRWKEVISECPPQFTMSLCSQASLLSWKLTKSSWEVPNELPALPSARPHQKLFSSAEWNLFSRIILRWDRCLCLPDVLWRPANLPMLSQLQDHRWGNWHEPKHRCQVR